MFHYLSGKRLAAAGFAMSLLHSLLRMGANIFLLPRGDLVFARALQTLNIVSLLAGLITVAGFGLMWLNRRDLSDLAPAALIVLSVVYSLVVAPRLGMDSLTYVLTSALVSAGLSAALYLVLAFRVRHKSAVLLLLLGCAFLYKAAVAASVIVAPEWFLSATGLGWNLLDLVCGGLCVLSVIKGE